MSLVGSFAVLWLLGPRERFEQVRFASRNRRDGSTSFCGSRISSCPLITQEIRIGTCDRRARAGLSLQWRSEALRMSLRRFHHLFCGLAGLLTELFSCGVPSSGDKTLLPCAGCRKSSSHTSGDCCFGCCR